MVYRVGGRGCVLWGKSDDEGEQEGRMYVNMRVRVWMWVIRDRREVVRL